MKPDNIAFIISVLDKKKEALLHDIQKLSAMINKKQSSLVKVQDYHKLYSNQQGQSTSFSLPTLCKNYQMFLSRLENVMMVEEKIIADYTGNREKIYAQMKQVNAKINAMKIILTNIQHLADVKMEIKSAHEMDDMIASRFLGE